MGDEPADDSDEEPDTTRSFVWETISEDILVDANEQSQNQSYQSPLADGESESPDSESGSENDAGKTPATELEQLIAEDPTGARPDEKETQRTESGQSNASSSERSDDKSGTRKEGSGRRSMEPDSGRGYRNEKPSDRIWNRFGSADEDAESRSRTSSDNTRSKSEDTGETVGAEQTDREEKAKRESESSGQEHENAQSRADETETASADSDRLWNQGDPDTSQTASAAPDSIDDAQASGDRTTGGGAETSNPETSFDHLLEGSDSGAGTARPVGSPSVETDLDAFFDDLEEFDRATSGSQVLVISPRDHSISDDVCSQFLTAGDVSGRNAVFVTAVDPPEDRVEICRSNENWTGGKVAVIELGDTGSESEERLGSIGGEEVVHKRVNSPKNLSKTGLLITQTLKKWSSSDQPSLLCFHTLTAISGYIENETLFQFLFTLQAKLNSLGVTGHYHMDASRHDQQEINTLKTLFDLVITISQNGEIEVE